MKQFLLLLALVIFNGCQVSEPLHVSPDPAPYLSFQRVGAYRLIPGGQTRWDTAWKPGVNRYDSAREVLASVESLWVDTSWGAIPMEPLTRLWQVMLLANERSKEAGLDTVYQWTGIDTAGPTDSLLGFKTRTANGFRIPTSKEAKYLVWGGATTRWAWGDASLNSGAYTAELWGDTAKTAWNRFGVVIMRPAPEWMNRKSHSWWFSAIEGIYDAMVMLPIEKNWKWGPAQDGQMNRWVGAPVWFVRSAH